MKVTTTRVKFEVRGPIEDGPEVPLTSWQRSGSGRRVVAWQARLKADGTLEVELMAQVLNQDGSVRDKSKSSVINSWDKESWELPAVQDLMAKIRDMVEETYPLAELSPRPALDLETP